MDIKSVVCYRCQEMGHYARDCPTRKRNQGRDGNGTVGRMINIDANTHASAFQLDEEGSSQSSYNSAQERLTNGMPITIGSGHVGNTSCRNVVDMRQAINGDDVLYLQDDI